MKKGFTLIELLVVIGIMGMLGTIAVGGYSAVTRGMAERGALDAARGIAEIAYQRAQIDRTKTYLFVFNEVTRVDSDDNVGIACGLAIAVRPIGRFSRVSGNNLYDEFADLNQSYAALDDENESESQAQKENSSATVQIYNLRDGSAVSVREGVFVGGKGHAEPDLADNGQQHEILCYGFKKVAGSNFNVGDEYGQEFSVMRLPPGYVFSGSVPMASPSDLGLRKVKVVTIDPGDGSAPSLEVYARRIDGSFRSIGQTSQVKDFKR